MSKSQFVESLESRRLMSVSGLTLSGPLTPGTQTTIEVIESGKVAGSTTSKIIGKTTFNGHSVTEIDAVPNGIVGTSVAKSYVAYDNTKGALRYGTVISTKSPGFTESSTTVFAPAAVGLPAIMNAGQTITTVWTAKTVMTLNGKTTTTNSSLKVSFKLVSQTPQTVITPAGKFSAYLIDETFTTTANGKTTTSPQQFWYAPNVGPVKSIAGTGAYAITLELTSFKKG